MTQENIIYLTLILTCAFLIMSWITEIILFVPIAGLTLVIGLTISEVFFK